MSVEITCATCGRAPCSNIARDLCYYRTNPKLAKWYPKEKLVIRWSIQIRNEVESLERKLKNDNTD